MKDGKQDLVESIFSRPSQAEAGECDANLRHGEKLFRMGQEREGHLRTGVPLIGEMAQAGIADRKERDLGRGEERVHRKD